MRTTFAAVPISFVLMAGCTEVGCGFSLNLEPVPYTEPALGGTVTVCQDDACADAVVEEEPAWLSVGDFEVALDGSGDARTARLHQWHGRGAIDGEHRYRLELAAADGRLLGADEWTVRFESFRPNGPFTDPECARSVPVE